MNIRDLAGLRRHVGQRLEQTDYDPRKLLLLHTGVTVGISLLITLLNYLLSLQIADTGGLAGMETRAVLESLQTVLQLVATVVLPFWQMGILLVGLRISRGEGAIPQTLLGGLRRFAPLLRLQLLRGMMIMGISIICCYVCTRIYMMLPVAQALVDALTPIVEQASVLNEQLVLDEATTALIMEHMLPLLIFYAVAIALLAIPLLLRLRLSEYLIFDGENRARVAMAQSRMLTKGNLWAMVKVDLQFWPFYLLLGLSMVLCYAELWLPALGIRLPISDDAAYFLFYVLYALAQVGIYTWMGAKVYTAYGAMYDCLRNPTELTTEVR